MRQPSVVPSLLLMMVAGCVLVGVISGYSNHRHFAGADTDGVKYVQAAHSLLDGRGLVHAKHDANAPWGEVWEPISLWPPGYPLLIAATSRLTGADALTSAVWISRAAWALLPALLLLCLAPFRLGAWTPIVALLVAFSPAFISCGVAPRSDTPFAVLSCLALLSLLRFLAEPARVTWLLGAGVLAGLSYTVRTVGVTLVIAVPLALLSAPYLGGSRQSARVAVRELAAWVIGAGVPIAMVLAYNLKIFGQLNPYSMPPSTVGPLDNVRALAFALIFEITGARGFSEWVEWNRVPLLVAALLATCVLAEFGRRLIGRGARQPLADVTYFVTLLLYAAGSCVLLVLVRSRYQWGSGITERYVAPFAWILLASILSLILERWPLAACSGAGQVVLAMACLVAAGTRIQSVIDVKADSSLEVAADADLQRALRAWAGQGDVIVSDSGPMLSLLGDVNVRQMTYERSESCVGGYETPLLSLARDRSLTHVTLHAVMLTKSLCLDPPTDPSSLPRTIARSDWRIAQSTPHYVVLEAPASRPVPGS